MATGGAREGGAYLGRADHGGSRVCADFDTRSRQAYVSVGGILPDDRPVEGTATDAAWQACQMPIDPAVLEAFAGSCERLSQTLGWVFGGGGAALWYGRR